MLSLACSTAETTNGTVDVSRLSENWHGQGLHVPANKYEIIVHK